jgi:hypothetical protein
MYNHPTKRCNNGPRCAKCTAEDHATEDCTADEPKCFQCPSPTPNSQDNITRNPTEENNSNNPDKHQSGDRSCPAYQREQKICSTQDKHKVSRRRAQQILTDELIPPTEELQPNTPHHFKILFSNASNSDENLEDRPPVSPFSVLRTIRNLIGEKPEEFSRKGMEYHVKVRTTAQSEKLSSMKYINTSPCTVTPHSARNIKKGLIYTNDFQCRDPKLFLEGVKKDYNLEEALEATWIKPKNPRTRAFLLSFATETLPTFISIPGEQALTQVKPHIPSPMRCKTCQTYGHTTKRCMQQSPTCGRCADSHTTSTCSATSFKCINCSQAHPAGSSNCTSHIYERELCKLMQKTGKSRTAVENEYYRRPIAAIGNLTYVQSTSVIQTKPVPNKNQHVKENKLPGKGSATQQQNNENRQTKRKKERAVDLRTEGTTSMDEATESILQFQTVNKTALAPLSEDLLQIFSQSNTVPPAETSTGYFNTTGYVTSIPETPEHLTSENDPLIRNEAEEIYLSTTDLPHSAHSDRNEQTPMETTPKKKLKREPTKGKNNNQSTNKGQQNKSKDKKH